MARGTPKGTLTVAFDPFPFMNALKVADRDTNQLVSLEKRAMEEGRKILAEMQASLPTYEAFEDDEDDDLADIIDDRD